MYCFGLFCQQTPLDSIDIYAYRELSSGSNIHMSNVIFPNEILRYKVMNDVT